MANIIFMFFEARIADIFVADWISRQDLNSIVFFTLFAVAASKRKSLDLFKQFGLRMSQLSLRYHLL